jgi:hypothetical protein
MDSRSSDELRREDPGLEAQSHVCAEQAWHDVGIAQQVSRGETRSDSDASATADLSVLVLVRFNKEAELLDE